MSDLASLTTEILENIKKSSSLDEIETLRVDTLGKKGKITSLMKTLGTLSAEERKAKGQEFNVIKEKITHSLEGRRQDLELRAMEAKLTNEKVDITLPIQPEQNGSIHPISQTIEEVISFFATKGFTVAEGNDVETGYFNFTALNIPEHHPARQMHDTFYMQPDETGEERVLRTHTSPVQIHTMKEQQPPIRILIPGRTFRSDHDMTHTPMFHQIEGLVIDKSTHMGHLKGTLISFLRAYFGVNDLPVRFRPSYFPFTEPSAEVDIACVREGSEFKIGAGDNWLEILGCGMVHPKVIENCGLDPEEYQGFAFGMGVERIAMLKHGVSDLRSFFDSDLRWLRHYGFKALDIPSLLKGL